MRSDQQMLTILLLFGLAGAALYFATRGPAQLSPVALAYARNGHSPSGFAEAVPYYGNEERYEIEWQGFLPKSVTVHRDARRG